MLLENFTNCYTSQTKSSSIRIIFLLNESNTFSDYRQAVINHFNKWMKSLKSLILNPENIKFTLVRFNIITKIENFNSMADVKPLLCHQYEPEDQSCYLDALGSSIKEFSHESHTIVIILTDGQDSSRKYTKSRIDSLVETLTIEKSWLFHYFGLEFEKVNVIPNASYGMLNYTLQSPDKSKFRRSFWRLEDQVFNYIQRKFTEKNVEHQISKYRPKNILKNIQKSKSAGYLPDDSVYSKRYKQGEMMDGEELNFNVLRKRDLHSASNEFIDFVSLSDI